MTVSAPAVQAANTEWDKTFALDDRVAHEKVRFTNRFGIELAADLYRPKNLTGKLPAIAVSGPFGAVKEQASGLYAQELAIRGFVTVAFDPSFTGESGGVARNVASPDINAEDFSAAVDYLSLRDDVDPNKIGICGICGWGGLSLRAAMLDTRIKATVASTMYDMCRVTGQGYFDSMDANARHEMMVKLNAQRTADAKAGKPARAGGVSDKLPDDAPWFVKDYFDYYKTERGYHPRSLNSNAGWNVKENFDFLSELVDRFTSHGIRTSIFVGTELENLEWAAKTGTDRVELYTEPYASGYAQDRDKAIAPFIEAAQFAKNQGLGVNAGHDLSLENLAFFSQNIPWLEEVSIGHALICDALYLGLKETIAQYKACLQSNL